MLTARFGKLRDWTVEEGVSIYRCPARRVAPERSNILEMASFILGGMVSMPKVVSRIRPDACIAFFSIPGGPVALLGNLVWRLPYVVSLRGGDVPGSDNTLKWSHRLLTPLRRMILRRSRAVVAVCHHGGRSQQVAMFLEKSGFAKVHNLQGGVDGWSRSVDPSVPLY